MSIAAVLGSRNRFKPTSKVILCSSVLLALYHGHCCGGSMLQRVAVVAVAKESRSVRGMAVENIAVLNRKSNMCFDL